MGPEIAVWGGNSALLGSLRVDAGGPESHVNGRHCSEPQPVGLPSFLINCSRVAQINNFHPSTKAPPRPKSFSGARREQGLLCFPPKLRLELIGTTDRVAHTWPLHQLPTSAIQFCRQSLDQVLLLVVTIMKCTRQGNCMKRGYVFPQPFWRLNVQIARQGFWKIASPTPPLAASPQSIECKRHGTCLSALSLL